MRELAQHVGHLSFGGAFVDMMVPSANIGKRHLHAQVRLDKLRELPQAVAKASLGIIGAGRGLVLRRVGGLQHLHRVKRFFTRAMQHGVDGMVVHGLKRARSPRSLRIPSADRKVVDVIHRNGRLQSTQDPGNRRPHGDGLKRRFLRLPWEIV